MSTVHVRWIVKLSKFDVSAVSHDSKIIEIKSQLLVRLFSLLWCYICQGIQFVDINQWRDNNERCTNSCSRNDVSPFREFSQQVQYKKTAHGQMKFSRKNPRRFDAHLIVVCIIVKREKAQSPAKRTESSFHERVILPE